MKVFKCDICGRETGEKDITGLAEWVACPDIKHACDSCLTEIQDANIAIKKLLSAIGQSWIKRFIIRLRAEKK